MKSALKAVLYREQPHRKPIWFMRQAGRYLPEYQQLRKKHSMLELIRTAELAAEVTLQPLRRFDLDAAIIFADILNPLIGMGAKLDFVEGEGPRIFNPVRSEQDVAELQVPETTENVGYTLQAIKIVRSKLADNIEVLGFAGAPFTLSCYLVEGGRLGELDNLLHFMRSQSQAWSQLQEKLCSLISSYLVAQVASGVSAVQLFDSWVGELGPYEFDLFVAPYLKKLLESYREQSHKLLGRAAPIIYFSTASAGLITRFINLGFDGIALDPKCSIDQVQRLAPDLIFQGNLDPKALFLSTQDLKKRTDFVIQDARSCKNHIFNLGHGILPKTPIANVEELIRIVRNS